MLGLKSVILFIFLFLVDSIFHFSVFFFLASSGLLECVLEFYFDLSFVFLDVSVFFNACYRYCILYIYIKVTAVC